MPILIYTLLAVIGLLSVIIYGLTVAMLKSSDRVNEINTQLMLLVAGQEPKPETLRALVASQKPPQGKLKGIATEPTKKKEPTNKDFTLNIGGTGGVQI